ncbi:single-stranded DNA-binding protein [Candidatus Dependentiae bacterium]|nr:single-stranded DNA-binding protein [Candidatus Dependentiae bacterium]
MAAGYNRVVMIGNLTRDPDYKQLASGQAVVRLGLASNRQYRNRQTGDMVQEVCFVDVDVWGAQAESCRQYLEKGRPVLVEGRLKFDQWEDQSGQNRSKHSIVADRVVFLSGSSDSQFEGQDKATADNNNNEQTESENEMERELMAQIKRIKDREVQPTLQAAARPSKQGGDTTSAVVSGAKRAATTTARNVEENQSMSLSETSFDFEDQPPFQDDLPF